jgi:branched-chain amino acid transport system permease protein
MAFFFQELVSGLTAGALYALVALGFSMVYGVLKLLNFAHGDLYMIGAYVGFFVIQWFGGATSLSISVPLLLVIMFVLAAGLVGGLGVAIERFAYRPLRDAPRIAPLITAIGVSFFLENARCCSSARSTASTTRRTSSTPTRGSRSARSPSTRSRSWSWSWA